MISGDAISGSPISGYADEYVAISQPENGAAYDPRPRYKRIYKDEEEEKESLDKVEATEIAQENEKQKNTESEIEKRFLEKLQKSSIRAELIAQEIREIEVKRIQEEEEYMIAICIALLV